MDNVERDREMPFLRNIGLVMTKRCQVRCPHCILDAGPDRSEAVATDEADGWIDQIASYRNGYIKVLSLTGGEPFFDLESMKIISESAASRGLIVTAVTNAFWASSTERAVEVLSTLPALKLISVSTDVYHQRSIPFERVVNAVHAAERLDVPCTLSVCTEDENDRDYQLILERLRQLTVEENIFTAVTFIAGRAARTVDRRSFTYSPEPPESACAAGSSPIVFPNGNVVACIGPVVDIAEDHPLLLGNLRRESLSEILDRAERNPVLHAIRIWGPKKIIAMMEAAGLSHMLPSEYVRGSICNACYSLMSSRSVREEIIRLANDPSFEERVAYGRAYYLDETRMVECLRSLQNR